MNYYKTKHWKVAKQNLRKRAKKCNVCGSTRNLQVHHIGYKKDGVSVYYNEGYSDLRVLCKECHKLYHDMFGKANKDDYKLFKIAYKKERNNPIWKGR